MGKLQKEQVTAIWQWIGILLVPGVMIWAGLGYFLVFFIAVACLIGFLSWLHHKNPEVFSPIYTLIAIVWIGGGFLYASLIWMGLL